MANSGYSSDCRLLRYCVTETKLIKLSKDDDEVAFKLKSLINDLVINDVIANGCYAGQNYLTHSAWNFKSKILVKMNQIRTKYRYFKPLKNG